jgi:hypothetical protein
MDICYKLVGIVAHVYILLNFEDKISIRRGECSIPDFRSIIVEILIR